MTLKDELLRLIGSLSTTGEEQKNSSIRNEEAELKQKQCPVVDVLDGESKVWCYKEQYCIGTWNVRSTNQGKLEVVKQEMARVNIDTLGITELKWTGKGEFNSDDHYIYYCGQESFRRNGVAFIVNKRVWNAVLGYNLKNDRMISVYFQGKPFTVIWVSAPATNAKEAEVEWLCGDLQDLLELTSIKKKDLFIIGDWNVKVESQEIPGVTDKFGFGVQNESGQRLTVLPSRCTGHSKHPLPTTTQEKTLHMDITDFSQYQNQIDYILCSQRWRSSIQSAKTRPGADCG